MNRPLGLDPFATQSRRAHALTVLGGIAVCLLAYFGAVAAVYGDLSVLTLESNIGAQRVGGAVAGVAVWTYFSLAFVRGYGGPVLNVLPYPVAVVVLAPFPARWLLFGPDVSGLRSRFVGFFVFEPLITTGIAVLPGLAACTVVLTAWASLIGDEARERWERRHLTREFYDAFVDVEE
ncbi:hypothetical protein [Natronosalvus rutilus]|uniref:Uncharacterized protein n=1 Tax=Natronosalvus rutilus TaxID=2953753 RepID=A0A9E7SU59_9EURY|nr:hypothetical protein [Natronosalvus rutilus]UTF54399.1 hypothetical protein NGM29_03725 [Natronosalvus rutilus]